MHLRNRIPDEVIVKRIIFSMNGKSGYFTAELKIPFALLPLVIFPICRKSIPHDHRVVLYDHHDLICAIDMPNLTVSMHIIY